MPLGDKFDPLLIATLSINYSFLSFYSGGCQNAPLFLGYPHFFRASIFFPPSYSIPKLCRINACFFIGALLFFDRVFVDCRRYK